MIEQLKINTVITEGLKRECGCEIVKSNITSRMPSYPYISFTVLNTNTKKGVYSAKEGIRYIPLTQTWSFTVQADDDDKAQIIAMKAKDWLEETGQLLLNDNGIIVQSAGAITNRDTLLTIGYEYRKGFDVVFSIMNMIEWQEDEIIEYAEIVKE